MNEILNDDDYGVEDFEIVDVDNLLSPRTAIWQIGSPEAEPLGASLPRMELEVFDGPNMIVGEFKFDII